MKISYNEATSMGCSTLERDLFLCEKIGYDYIEIRIDMLRTYLETHSSYDLKTFFKNNRIKPHAFNSLDNINFCSGAEWKIIIEDFILACEIGKIIGSNCIVAAPTFLTDPGKYSEKEVFEDSVNRLKELLTVGKDYGMKLAFEPIGNRCVDTIQKALAIINSINNGNLGLTLDAFNLYLKNKSNNFNDINIIEKDKIFVVHIDDSPDLPIEVLNHHHRCFPLDGVIDLKNFIRNLKNINYDGMLSIELINPEYWLKGNEWIIKKGYDSIKSLIESV